MLPLAVQPLSVIVLVLRSPPACVPLLPVMEQSVSVAVPELSRPLPPGFNPNEAGLLKVFPETVTSVRVAVPWL